ncbi:MAG: hypothetical protein U9O41_09500 [Candidatus Aerophobetes bacterium]|nr:hypothetical protein [Candidatus Aerophobetes bacterium]
MRNRDYSFYYWIPAIVWMGLILVGGSPYGFFIGNKVRHFTYMSQVLKGIFHIGEFAILTVFILIPLNKRKLNFGSIITWAIIMGSGVALLSECSQFLFSSHQLFEWIDLGMNEVGIGVVLLFYSRKAN